MSDIEPDDGGGGMSGRKLCALFRRAANARFPIPEAELKRTVETCVRLLSDPDPRVSCQAVRALVAMEQQNQIDDHLADKNERLDEGKLTDRVGIDTPIIERPIRRIASN